MTQLSERLAAVMSEAESPTHATIASVQAQLAPILAFTTDSQKQIAEHRSRLLQAQADDASNDGDLDRLHQTLDAWEREAKALLEAARHVRTSALQYERYAGEIKVTLLAKAEAAAAAAVPVAA